MALTYLKAKDEMFAMFKTAWDASHAAIIAPYTATVYYPGDKKPSIPPSNGYSVFVELLVLSEEKATVGKDIGFIGGKVYNNQGLLKIKIICPLSDAQNSDRGARLGIVARDAFRGKHSPCGVVFYRTVVKPLPETEVFSSHLMITEYNYNDIS